MSWGVMLLIIAIILLLFGNLDRALRRLELNKWLMLGIALAMLIGNALPPLTLSEQIQLSIGGALVPVAAAIAFLFMARGSRRLLWDISAVALVMSGVLFAHWMLPSEPRALPFDTAYLFVLLVALLSYLLGRQARRAFICAALGMLSVDAVRAIEWQRIGLRFHMRLGSGAAFDAIIVALLLSLVLCDVLAMRTYAVVARRRAPEVRRL